MIKTALHANCCFKKVSHCRRYPVPMSSLSCANVVVIVCNTFLNFFLNPLLRLVFHHLQNECDSPKDIKNIKHAPTCLAAVGRHYN